ncbi:type II secretion system protein GspM [Leucothrix pacifica]|uniref:Type II secretion system protein M n=1 Tax=Leucothrix pacifica TaxID=1247513 RepID=A0A317CPT0_9GAMM|nr:type II secretion system protein GspM [Leucothrix pacifica]PWR00238.1 hypothetical protein DKW60_03615 [Leucothrix pacifica]
MKQWFMMLSSREKTLVSIAAVLVPILLIWLLLLQPMLNKHTALAEQIEDRSAILQNMRQQSAEIKILERSGGNRKTVSTGNPQQKVDSALRTWRLRSTLGEMSAPNSTTVRLNLRDAEADNIMRFLFDLETKYGLTVKDFSMKPTKDVGKANANLTLEVQ